MATETMMHEEMVRIGAKIREFRRRKGVTIHEMAATLKLSPTHLSRIEMGKRMISAEDIYDISKYLELPIEEIVIKKSELSMTESKEEMEDERLKERVRVVEQINEIGVKVSRARIQKENSQREIAQMFGMTNSEIARIEAGKALIPSKHIYDFSNYFGIPMEELVVKASALEIERILKE